MPRLMKAAAAQLGPIGRKETRKSVVDRMITLLRQANQQGVKLVVFPEMALTTFFPRWYIEDEKEVDSYYETEMPGPETQKLFDVAKDYGIGFYLGYCEKTVEGGKAHRYNTSILVDDKGTIVGKYRKIHLPGHADNDPKRPWQHLEKYYFEVGNLGFPVWRTMGAVMGMCLCNDRRWPETFRVMGLQGVELVMLGYNTPSLNAVGLDKETPELRMFHNHLSMQAGAYQNGTYVIGTAKAGMEEGCHMQGGSAIVHPNGKIIAMAKTEGDELVTAELDFDECTFTKTTVFAFEKHRRPEHYKLIVERTGAVPPQ
jgi:N-carbamoyl-D-amino-acid hydrolase